MSGPAKSNRRKTQSQRRWWLLGAMSCVLGLMVLDETVVSVALPSIKSEFGLTASAAHWVINAYLLAFTCSVAVVGRLGDLFDRKRYFSLGAILFGVASLLAALAPDGETLIAARALQGVAAAMIFPTSLALITAAFPPSERGVAFGYQTTVGGVFMASGPLVGGLLTETLSWRAIFWIGIPVATGITVLLWLIWTTDYDIEKHEPLGRHFGTDFRDAALLVFGLLGLVAFLMQGSEWGWTSTGSLGLIAIGSTLLAFFLHRAFQHRSQFLDVSLMKSPVFACGTLVFAIFQFEKIAIFVFSAQFFQTHLGLTPIVSGMLVSLAILPALGTSVLVGKMSDTHGSRKTLMYGAFLHGFAVLALALASAVDTFWLALFPLLAWGATMPSIAIPTRRQQMNSVPEEKHVQAGGINLTVQFLGGCLGLAACSALFAETNSYLLLFGVVGLATLLCVPIARRGMM